MVARRRIISNRMANICLMLVMILWLPAASAFVISDIRVEGLQRISAGIVFGAIAYNVGDDIGVAQIRLIGQS